VLILQQLAQSLVVEAVVYMILAEEFQAEAVEALHHKAVDNLDQEQQIKVTQEVAVVAAEEQEVLHQVLQAALEKMFQLQVLQ
jgi:hypothetical protein